MTIYDKLRTNFNCAIVAIFGEMATEEYTEEKVGKGDIELIAQKVMFYLDIK